MRHFPWLATLALVAGCATRPEAQAPPAHETRAAEPPPWIHDHPEHAPVARCPVCGQPIAPSPTILIPGTFEPPAPKPEPLSDAEALRRASVGGKYTKLLRTLDVPDDFAGYGAFRDWGWWAGTSYAGFDDLPPGNWVYVYPRWYVWE